MTGIATMRIAVTAIMMTPLIAACIAVTDLGDDEAVLTAFDECGSLLDHLRSEYAERVGPWGFGPRPSLADIGETRLEPTAGLFETDGRRIFAVSKGRLVVVDAASRQIEGSARLASEYATELLLDGDNLLVILNDHSPPVRFALEPADGSPADEQPAGYDQPVVTVVQRVRVDGYTPRVVETLRIDGAHVSTHSIDGVARVVTHHDPSWSVPFAYPQDSAGEWEAEEANRAAILAGTLEDWLPSYAVGPDGSQLPVEGGLLADCENVYVPSVFAGFGVITAMSLPVGGPLAGNDAIAVMASSDIVHATPRSLYVATSAWIDPELLEDDDARRQIIKNRQTAVHRLDLTDPARAAYTASGTVPGRIHDQFSLSEHDGHLRAVTTTGDYWRQSNQVSVLKETDGRLVEVGSLDDIGQAQVQSVRFTGVVGYVATFSQADPFYIIDLTDPESPAVVGELEKSGSSSFLHPVGGDLVLGVGFDADESAGIKVSLFDVSRPADPQELSVWTTPGAFIDPGYWDRRAFLWWEPAQMAVFGLSDSDDRWAGSVVLRVADGSIAEIGRISTGSLGRPDIIVRSLVVGDELWTFSYQDGDVYGAVASDLAASDLTNLERTSLIKLF